MAPSYRPFRARHVRSGLLLLVSLLSATPVAADELVRHAFSGGAIEALGGSYRLRGTVGEAGLVGLAAGASYVVDLGFWPGHAPGGVSDAPDPPDTGEPGSVITYVDGLRQNFPNPFRGATTISFTVGQPSRVRLAVYDVAGRRLATLTDTDLGPGLYRADWEGRDLSGDRVASGVYFYRLDIGSWSATKRLLKLR